MSGSDYFSRYDEKADELYAAGKYAQVIAFLEPALKEFPEYYFDIALHLLLSYRELGELDNCLQVIESGNRQNHFFHLGWPSWDPIHAFEGLPQRRPGDTDLLGQVTLPGQ